MKNKLSIVNKLQKWSKYLFCATALSFVSIQNVQAANTPHTPKWLGDIIPQAQSTPKLFQDIQCPAPKNALQLNAEGSLMNIQNVYTFSWLAWVLYDYSEIYSIEEWLEKGGITNYRIIDIDGDGPQAIVAKIDNQLVVVYRGTATSTDIINDATFMPVSAEEYNFPGKIHEGFLNSYADVAGSVIEAVSEMSDSTKEVWLTGHSLGSVSAALTAYQLNATGFNIRGVYGFGSPLIGNAEFTSAYDAILKDKTFLFQYGQDIVAHIPPSPAVKEEFMAAFIPELRSEMGSLVDLMQYAYHGTHFNIIPTQGIQTIPSLVDSDKEYWQNIQKEDSLLPLTLATNSQLIDDHKTWQIYCKVEELKNNLP